MHDGLSTRGKNREYCSTMKLDAFHVSLLRLQLQCLSDSPFGLTRLQLVTCDKLILCGRRRVLNINILTRICSLIIFCFHMYTFSIFFQTLLVLSVYEIYWVYDLLCVKMLKPAYKIQLIRSELDCTKMDLFAVHFDSCSGQILIASVWFS